MQRKFTNWAAGESSFPNRIIMVSPTSTAPTIGLRLFEIACWFAMFASEACFPCLHLFVEREALKSTSPGCYSLQFLGRTKAFKDNELGGTARGLRPSGRCRNEKAPRRTGQQGRGSQ